MSEQPLAISQLNDFIFCPASIFFHSLETEENIMVQDSFQLNGTNAHKHSDSATYSTEKSVLQGVSVYCEKYNLIGKIDVFDEKTGILTERKKKIKTVYDGYIYQIYAQYFSLIEMGYKVNELCLYSMDDNKIHTVSKPEENKIMLDKFEHIISEINNFSFRDFNQSNISKCQRCIYEPLCSFSCLKKE